MPGVDRLGWRHGLIDAVKEARSFGVNQVVLFPKVQQLTDCKAQLQHRMGMITNLYCPPMCWIYACTALYHTS